MPLIVAFTPTAWEDYEYWQEHDEDILRKINKLIKEVQRDPFKGIGKPEALRGSLSGYWSRRITGEHRLVYKVEGEKPKQLIIIIQVRFHY